MSQQNSPLWKNPLFIGGVVVVLVVIGVSIYLLTKPSTSQTQSQSNEQLSSIQDRFNQLTTASNNTYQSLIDLQASFKTTLGVSKQQYDTAYSALKTKVDEAAAVYSNLLTDLADLNGKFDSYNSAVSEYTASTLTIPDPSDPTFLTQINEIKAKLSGFVDEGKNLITSYENASTTSTESITSKIEVITTDALALQALADDYEAKTVNGRTIVQTFKESDALENTNILLDSVKTVLDDSAKYTFSADDQKIIDKIKSSLTNISEKIKTVIADINSYNINSSLTELKANIDNLTSSAAGTKDQITAKIGEITSKISAVNLRSGNLNYAVSALQKNIELSNNYNDIKIFFDSLYPGGVPAPVNL